MASKVTRYDRTRQDKKMQDKTRQNLADAESALEILTENGVRNNEIRKDKNLTRARPRNGSQVKCGRRVD